VRGISRTDPTYLPPVAVEPVPFIPARADPNLLPWARLEDGGKVALEGEAFRVTGTSTQSDAGHWSGVITTGDFPDGDFVFSADVKISQPVEPLQNYTAALRVSTDTGIEAAIVMRPTGRGLIVVSKSLTNFPRARESSPAFHHVIFQFNAAMNILQGYIDTTGLGVIRGPLGGRRRFSMLVATDRANVPIDAVFQNQKILTGEAAAAFIKNPAALAGWSRGAAATRIAATPAVSAFQAKIAALKKPEKHSEPTYTLLGPRSRLTGDEAVFAYAVGDYLAADWMHETDETIRCFLEMYPDDQRALLLRAIVARSRLDIAGSKPLFEAVVKSNSGSIEGQCASLMLDIDAGLHPTSSFQALRTLTRAQTTNAQLQWLQGIAGQLLNLPQESRPSLSFVMNLGVPPLRLRDLHMDSYDWLSMFRASDKLIGDRQAAVAAAPAAWSCLSLARTLTSLHREPEAEAACARAVELEPKNASARVAWAESLIRLKRYPEAIAQCQKALEVDPQSVEAAAICGFALESSNRDADAMNQYRKAAGVKDRPEALMPESSIVSLSPAAAQRELIKYLSQGKQLQAETIGSALAARYPRDEGVLFAHAVLLRSRFYVQESMPLFRRLAELAPESPRGRCAKLMASIDGGDEAQKNFDALCDLARQNPADVLVVWTGVPHA
jgi:tetratricopeptide (TPR) repeat protein